MTRYIVSVIAVLLFVVGRAPANVYMEPKAYAASENLLIDLDEDEAHISGEFEFDITIDDKMLRFSTAHIPVWLPVHAQPDQKNLSALLETFSFQGRKQIELNQKKRAVLDQAIGLRIQAKGLPLDYDRLYTYEYDALLKSGLYPETYWRPGVNEVSFAAPLDKKLTSDGKLRIDVQYRQALIKTDGRTLLFYVPLFDNIYFFLHEKHPHKYKITVRCPQGCRLIARSEHKYSETPTASEMVIIPEDQQIILVELIQEGQAEVTTPLDPAWLKEPELVEAKGPSACACEHKNDIHLSAIYKTENNPMVTINGLNYFLGHKPLGFELMVIDPARVVFRCPEGKVIVRELL